MRLLHVRHCVSLPVFPSNLSHKCSAQLCPGPRNYSVLGIFERGKGDLQLWKEQVSETQPYPYKSDWGPCWACHTLPATPTGSQPLGVSLEPYQPSLEESPALLGWPKPPLSCPYISSSARGSGLRQAGCAQAPEAPRFHQQVQTSRSRAQVPGGHRAIRPQSSLFHSLLSACISLLQLHVITVDSEGKAKG